MNRFKLSELQAEYILELRLRRLTKFSKLELDSEAAQLKTEIAELKRILGDPTVLRALVSDELADVANRYATPRRTEIAGVELAAAKPLPKSFDAELADSPCRILLTASGMLLRMMPADSDDAQPATKRRKHDAIQTEIDTTTRTDVGFITSTGRVLRIHAGDIPAASGDDAAAAMVPAGGFLGLSKTERVLNVISLDDETPVAVGSALGVVKRVVADYPSKDEFEIISLKDGDELVGAAVAGDDTELIFVASDAQLLHFSAGQVRPQGRSASGMAGINLSDGIRAIVFLVANSADVKVVTAAHSSESLAGTDAGSVKVSQLAEFPAKGRATGGVRAHKFIRNEDSLYFAGVAKNPLAATADGKPLELPTELAKRDASGTVLTGRIASVGDAN